MQILAHQIGSEIKNNIISFIIVCDIILHLTVGCDLQAEYRIQNQILKLKEDTPMTPWAPYNSRKTQN